MSLWLLRAFDVVLLCYTRAGIQSTSWDGTLHSCHVPWLGGIRDRIQKQHGRAIDGTAE